jgi:hypothetical protein
VRILERIGMSLVLSLLVLLAIGVFFGVIWLLSLAAPYFGEYGELIVIGLTIFLIVFVMFLVGLD